MLVWAEKQNRFTQRVWIRGSRPEEEEIFQFTMIQVCSLYLLFMIVICFHCVTHGLKLAHLSVHCFPFYFFVLSSGDPIITIIGIPLVEQIVLGYNNYVFGQIFYLIKYRLSIFVDKSYALYLYWSGVLNAEGWWLVGWLLADRESTSWWGCFFWWFGLLNSSYKLSRGGIKSFLFQMKWIVLWLRFKVGASNRCMWYQCWHVFKRI